MSLDPLTAALAAGVSFVATIAAATLARRFGWLDVPDPRRSHVVPTPRVGGVGVLAGTAVAAGKGPVTGLALGALLSFVVGFVDDVAGLVASRTRRAGLPAWAKLLLQAGAAVVPVACFGVRFEGRASGPWPAIELGAAAAPMTVLWFVAVVNVVNFMDGIDAIVAATAVVLLATDAGAAPGPQSGLYLAAAAATVGFGFWNAPRARVFLGDGGSHLIGFLLASAACSSSDLAGDGAPLVSAVPWPLVAAPLLPFIVDVSEALLHKARHGIPMARAHNDHLYQRLVKAGRGVGTVAVRYALLAGFAIFLVGPVAHRYGMLAAVIPGVALLALHLVTGARATRGVPRLEIS